MQCLYPTQTNQGHVTCGQCLNCRIDRQREWTCRILLESKFYAETSFVTLTYNDESIPKLVDDQGNVSFTLSKSHLETFIHNFRDRYRHMDGRFRFFACGEYGMEENRPHYHLIVFGLGQQWGDLIEKTWGKGFITISEIIPQRAAYVAQYTLKKNWKWLKTQHHAIYPEFSAQSRMPGVGAINCCMKYLEDLQMSREGAEYIATTSDVVKCIQLDGKLLPLGNYLRKKLRDRCGVSQLRSKRLADLGIPSTWADKTEMVYGEDDYKWWDDHAFKWDIMHQNTPASMNAKKTRIQAELPEARRRRKVLERKKSKARLAFLSGGPASKDTDTGIGS